MAVFQRLRGGVTVEHLWRIFMRYATYTLLRCEFVDKFLAEAYNYRKADHPYF